MTTNCTLDYVECLNCGKTIFMMDVDAGTNKRCSNCGAFLPASWGTADGK